MSSRSFSVLSAAISRAGLGTLGRRAAAVLFNRPRRGGVFSSSASSSTSAQYDFDKALDPMGLLASRGYFHAESSWSGLSHVEIAPFEGRRVGE
jgi:hypothetical protein